MSVELRRTHYTHYILTKYQVNPESQYYNYLSYNTIYKFQRVLDGLRSPGSRYTMPGWEYFLFSILGVVMNLHSDVTLMISSHWRDISIRMN